MNQNNLLPCYFIYGTEPLQKLEKIATIVMLAKKNLNALHKIFEIHPSFDWEQIYTENNSMSLFEKNKLIELRLHTTITKQGHCVLDKIFSQPVPDNILLITTEKITPQIKNSAWFKKIQHAGSILNSKPLTNKKNWQDWIINRFKDAKLQVTPEIIETFSRIYEGNLLAAAQCIKKLTFLFPGQQLNLQDIEPLLNEATHYSVYELVDAALLANPAKTIQIFNSLMHKGLELPIILWALTREVRLLIQLHTEMAQSCNLHQIFKKHGIWQQRQSILSQTLSRLTATYLEKLMQNAHMVDIMIKGMSAENAQQHLLNIYLQLAGCKVFT